MGEDLVAKSQPEMGPRAAAFWGEPREAEVAVSGGVGRRSVVSEEPSLGKRGTKAAGGIWRHSLGL